MLNYLSIKPKKDFWVFYMFLKVILYFRVFSFQPKCIFVFFSKIWSKGSFMRSSWLRANVMNFVPFPPERMEFFIPVCKPEQEQPLFHLKSNFDQFWLVSGIPVNSGKFRPKCNFRPEWVLPFSFFLFLFFNLRIFFTITCKNFLSSIYSILHHSIKYNPKIHNNEVMNTQRERERERGVRTRRWDWIILWAWGRLLMKLRPSHICNFAAQREWQKKSCG